MSVRRLSLLLAFFVALAPLACNARARPEFPPELTAFEAASAEPIFKGAPGQWDAFIRERGWIVIDDGVWKLYYTGYDSPTGIRRLGLATSPDGLAWTRHADRPLVDDQWIEDMTIVKDGPTWHMFAEGKDDQAHAFTSDDGLAWTRVGPLDIRTTDDKPIPPGPFGTPAVFKEGDTWYLFYERSDQGVWLATSKDRAVWRHVQDEPIMTPGPDDYDRDMIALNQVIKHKGRYYAYYHGCQNDPDKTKRRWSPALASSTDLIHWKKFPGNPLLPRADNRSSGIVVPYEGAFRFYTMHPAVWAYRNK
jgi:sucrose-6-phosphate hydrolase SacC (GH32 family)